MVIVVAYRNLFYRASNLYEFVGYRTKRVGFIGDGASKLLALSLF